MLYDQFLSSLEGGNPPENISPYLLALWHDGRGDWEASHNVAQDIHDRNGSWIHAYLHRKEGDLPNAGYWYRQAGRPQPALTLQQEWEQLVKHFL